MSSRVRLLMEENGALYVGPRAVCRRLREYVPRSKERLADEPYWKFALKTWEAFKKSRGGMDEKLGLKLHIWREPRNCPKSRSRYVELLTEHGMKRPKRKIVARLRFNFQQRAMAEEPGLQVPAQPAPRARAIRQGFVGVPVGGNPVAQNNPFIQDWANLNQAGLANAGNAGAQVAAANQPPPPLPVWEDDMLDAALGDDNEV